MKPHKKRKLYITAAIVFVAGILIFTLGFTMLDFNTGSIKLKGIYKEKDYIPEADITQIMTEGINCEIKYSSSTDGKLHVVYYDNGIFGCEINATDDGVLKVTKNNSGNWFKQLFSKSTFTSGLKIKLPRNFDGNITVSGDNTDISITDISAGSIDAATKNGKISMKNMLLTGSFNSECKNGNTSFSDITVVGNITCSSNNGKIKLSSVTAGEIILDTSDGNISLSTIKSSAGITAVTVRGNISIEKTVFNTTLSCTAANGSVTGSLPGDKSGYSFSCQAVNGSSNLPSVLESDSPLVLVRTTNGNINVEYTG